MSYRKPYIESSVFIAFIKGEKKGANLEHDCEVVVGSILEAAKAGGFQIYTSALTIAEVHKKKRHVELTDQENEDLTPYFREDYIRLVEVDRTVGERANELCRTTKAKPGRPALRPNDAIHIACAEQVSDCDVILSYDPDFTKHEHRIPIEWPKQVVHQATNLFDAPQASTAALKGGDEPKLLTGTVEEVPAVPAEEPQKVLGAAVEPDEEPEEPKK